VLGRLMAGAASGPAVLFPGVVECRMHRPLKSI